MPPFRAPMPRRPTFRTHISGALTTLAVCAVGCGAASGSTEAFVTSGDAGLGPEVVSLRADAGSDGAREASSVGPVCGDQICNGTESCTTCPTDCGTCPSCSAAPSCSDGLALPSNPKTLKLSELTKPISRGDAGAPDTSSCTGAQLRLRIARIEVGHQGKRVWLPTGALDGPPQSYYCIVQATDGVVVGAGDAGTGGSVEVAFTKPTAEIPDNGSADFGPADSIFWGQAGPKLTQANLTITYSCFQQKTASNDAWASVFKAAGDAAGGVSNAGEYGWAFGLGGVALETVGAAIEAADKQGDWHMFDVTTTLDKSWLYDLTNGRRWSFTKEGGDAAFQNPWSITVVTESFGCSGAKPAPPR